ncbi:hypothetical protein MRX96_021463 [Rhipicephalus microplus]
MHKGSSPASPRAWAVRALERRCRRLRSAKAISTPACREGERSGSQSDHDAEEKEKHSERRLACQIEHRAGNRHRAHVPSSGKSIHIAACAAIRESPIASVCSALVRVIWRLRASAMDSSELISPPGVNATGRLHAFARLSCRSR